MVENNFEEIQLSNIWIKTHILDVIDELNQLQTIAKLGSLDINTLSQITDNEKTQSKLNALDLFEAKLEVLKGNVFFGIDKKRKLKITTLLILQNKISETCNFQEENSLNDSSYEITPNFFKKLKILQMIKEELIDACAEKGMLLPKVDDELETKTEKDWEDINE